MKNQNYKSKWHQARELEIQYNFAWRKYSGSFPAIVDERYCRFCISKGIMPKGPSIKCGYITNWKDYGETLDEAIECLTNELEYARSEYQAYQDEEGETPFERSGGYMREMVGLGECR
jgi:hypothetical protein